MKSNRVVLTHCHRQWCTVHCTWCTVRGAQYMVPESLWPSSGSPQHRKALASEAHVLQQLWVTFCFTSSFHLEMAKSNSSVHRCPKHAVNMPRPSVAMKRVSQACQGGSAMSSCSLDDGHLQSKELLRESSRSSGSAEWQLQAKETQRIPWEQLHPAALFLQSRLHITIIFFA